MAYIYKITNLINQKSYIGKTELIKPKQRWKEHQRDAKKESRNHRALYMALNKYGVDNFSFEVIEETNIPEEREIYWIDFYHTYHNGYNETLGGDGASYLCLPEQEICKTYLENHSIPQTALQFGHDYLTIKKVLVKNNIKILSAIEASRLIASKAVAKLDKETGEIIEVYSSVRDAELKNGNTRHIAQVCKGKRKSAVGYGWKYV